MSEELSNILNETFPHLVSLLIYQQFQLKSQLIELTGGVFSEQEIDFEEIEQMPMKEKVKLGIEIEVDCIILQRALDNSETNKLLTWAVREYMKKEREKIIN